MTKFFEIGTKVQFIEEPNIPYRIEHFDVIEGIPWYTVMRRVKSVEGYDDVVVRIPNVSPDALSNWRNLDLISHSSSRQSKPVLYVFYDVHEQWSNLCYKYEDFVGYIIPLETLAAISPEMIQVGEVCILDLSTPILNLARVPIERHTPLSSRDIYRKILSANGVHFFSSIQEYFEFLAEKQKELQEDHGL